MIFHRLKVPQFIHSPIEGQGFPAGSVTKNLSANATDTGSIPGLGRSPGKGNGNLLQESCLGNQREEPGRLHTVHGVAKSWTQLSMRTRTEEHLGCFPCFSNYGLSYEHLCAGFCVDTHFHFI